VAQGLTHDKKPLGNLTAAAETRGKEVTFDLASDIARAEIKGSGRMQLTDDYPLNAQLTFTNVTYSGISPLINGEERPIEAIVEGRANIAGPIVRPEALKGEVRIAKLEARSAPSPTGRKPRTEFELHNAEPIVVALDRNVLTVRSARITGPFTELAVTGSASLGDRKMNLRADGNIKLEILEAFNPDIYSAGNIALNASVTGTTDNPVINGKVQLQKASFNMLDLPNGLSNGNGTILFNGRQAVIQNLTAETGGGKITLAGNIGFGGSDARFRIEATADSIRVTAPQTVTTAASAKLALAGTTTRSLLSGTVTIEEVVLRSNSDIGSMLSQAATPPPVERRAPACWRAFASTSGFRPRRTSSSERTWRRTFRRTRTCGCGARSTIRACWDASS
jgi:translocation and assembly module TamB